MIYISTDYVFDGLGNKTFEVNSPKNRLSTYSATKSLDKYFIIHVSWAFGKNENIFIKKMLKLANIGKKELNIVCDLIGSPTYTYDLSKLLCDMIETDKYGIYHATNERFTSWAESAEEIFRQAKKMLKCIMLQQLIIKV